jgi:hypothetical protein
VSAELSRASDVPHHDGAIGGCLRRMTPIPHHRRDETVDGRRAELGIQAVRTETTMAVRPKRAPSGAAHAFHLESRGRHPLNLTGLGV